MSYSERLNATKFEGTVYGIVLDDVGSMDYYETLEQAQLWANGSPIMKVTTKLLPDNEIL